MDKTSYVYLVTCQLDTRRGIKAVTCEVKMTKPLSTVKTVKEVMEAIQKTAEYNFKDPKSKFFGWEISSLAIIYVMPLALEKPEILLEEIEVNIL